MDRSRLIRVGGTVTWLAVAVPLAIALPPSTTLTRIALWAGSWLVFGLALHRGWLLIEVAAVIGMVLTMCDEIAHALGAAEGTVKNHVSNILSKLGARDRTRAVLKALEAGFLT
jgi:hypothetical protein